MQAQRRQRKRQEGRQWNPHRLLALHWGQYQQMLLRWHDMQIEWQTWGSTYAIGFPIEAKTRAITACSSMVNSSNVTGWGICGRG
jgi:hypothetical protein